MLRELRLNNLAIIKSLDLEIGEGLISMTGETGAGKSIILDGISLLIGERASLDMIRTGEDALYAEGIFDISEEQKRKLNDLGYEIEDDELIITRYFDRNSKAKIAMNGNRLTVSKLKEVMGNILDLVGQHDHQYILNKNFHLDLLDKFLDAEGKKVQEELRQSVKDIKKISRKIAELESERLAIINKKDMYEFQLGEINAVNIKEKEDEELETEYKLLFNSGKISEKVGESVNLLRDSDYSVMNFLSKIKKNLEQLGGISEDYEKLIEKIDGLIYDIEEIYYKLDDMLQGVESNDSKLEKVITKINGINKLKQKYGDSIEEILAYRDGIQRKLELINFGSDELDDLKREKKEKVDEYLKKAEKLRKIRKEIANYLETEIDGQLKDLNMASAKFKVSFTEKKVISSKGMDEIEFLMKTNVGEDFKSLARIASGGEISRIMLALKIIFSKVDNISVLIFDEIDTGISGETIRKVAEKLKGLSKRVQVICVTHSPQIAGKANQQFLIRKEVENGFTETRVKELTLEERLKEIARIISGDNISEVSINHAKEIMGIK